MNAATSTTSTGPADEEYDLVIVGSGGGSICAALVAQSLGLRAVIIEKQDKVGGSTAYSGGVIWIPDNDYLRAIDAQDSYERSRQYMDGLIGEVGPASSPARRDAFIRTGPQMLRFLESHGMRFLHAGWPDYYSDRPGGLWQGRSLVAPLFDLRELGAWEPKLARFFGFPAIPLGTHEANALGLVKRTWSGKRMALRVAGRILLEKLTGRRLRGSGNALQGRLLQIALRARVPIWTGTPARDLIVSEGRVVGVQVERDGRTLAVRARCGVLLNCGGFSRNLAMRERYQPAPAAVKWTLANPGDTGEMIEAAMRLGAAVDLMNESWWVPGSFMPDGSFVGFHVPTDAGKPHCIVVNAAGERFANESGAYMEFGQRAYACGAVPAWAILDSRHRRYYSWGATPPGGVPKHWLDTGYCKQADTIEALARQCGIDGQGLIRTVERFNGFAATGRDTDFDRGGSYYNRYNGDPTVKPNACLGAIEQAPFYAIAIYPADVGTAGGVLTDEFARVLRADGTVIPGLYATGNCTASVMGRCYPGAGASIGAAFTFGYIAAHHAASCAPAVTPASTSAASGHARARSASVSQ